MLVAWKCISWLHFKHDKPTSKVSFLSQKTWKRYAGNCCPCHASVKHIFIPHALLVYFWLALTSGIQTDTGGVYVCTNRKEKEKKTTKTQSKLKQQQQNPKQLWHKNCLPEKEFM